MNVVQPLSAAVDKPAPAVASPGVAPSQPVASAPLSAEVTTASRERRIGMFVMHDVLTLSPDAATERLGSVYPIRREAETVDGFLLVGKTPTEELNFDYVADGKGGFLCQQATLEFYVATTEESAALYRDIEQQLQAKLGKPKKYPSAPDTPYWKLVRRVQVSLTDRGSSRRIPNGRVVAIRISEPDGP